MAKKKERSDRSELDKINDWLGSLTVKKLKQAAILRGMGFRELSGMDVHRLQSWLFKRYNEPIKVSRLQEYDEWLETTLMEEGSIDGPIHVDLKLGLYAKDEDGNVIRKKRDVFMMGVNKTTEEIASFQPQRGTKKQLVFQLIRAGKSTPEVIEEVMAQFTDAKVGSIKSWCSKARRSVKAAKSLDES